MKDINSLAQDANDLFIYAATICQVVDKQCSEKQLSIILQCMRSSSLTLQRSPTQSLNEMYFQVLKSSIYMHYDEENQDSREDSQFI